MFVVAIDLFPKAEVMALEPELPLLEGRKAWRGPAGHAIRDPSQSRSGIWRYFHCA